MARLLLLLILGFDQVHHRIVLTRCEVPMDVQDEIIVRNQCQARVVTHHFVELVELGVVFRCWLVTGLNRRFHDGRCLNSLKQEKSDTEITAVNHDRTVNEILRERNDGRSTRSRCLNVPPGNLFIAMQREKDKEDGLLSSSSSTFIR